MADFRPFGKLVSQRFAQLAKDSNELFSVELPDIFDIYINAFPAGTNPLFRERTEHDCNCCKHFIRNIGKVAAINDGEIATVWDVAGLEFPYDVVARALGDAVRSAAIQSVFRTKESSYSHEKNLDNHDTSITWYHFHARVPSKFVNNQPGTVKGQLASMFQVFKRGLNEIRQDDLEAVLDLIKDNALYRGREFEKSIKDFKALQKQYATLGSTDAFIWENVHKSCASFRNTVIGTLLTDLADGDDIETAVKKFEAKVAPVNYKRPTALITAKMIEKAVETLRSLGLENVINRRLARIEDLSVNDVLFVDNSVASKMKDGLVDLLLESAAAKKTAKTPKNPKPIKIDDFLKAGHKSIDLILDPAQVGNFVALTAPNNEDTARLFKWSNNFAWSYDGEVTDSIKQRVAKAGGNVHNAKLRVSLAWFNYDDLDIHAFPPNGSHIYYGNRSGVLDVDMNAGERNSREPVENLSWTSLQDGVYRIEVNQFRKRESTDTGFALQVETEGCTQEFRYDRALVGTVKALNIEVAGGKVIGIKPGRGLSGGGNLVVEKWGISTGSPAKVQAILLSPNHWESAGGIGNKHWFFILEGCRVDEPVRGLYNEFLRNELEPHRKVFEVLSSRTKCQPTDKQLSGVGFSETRSDKVVAIADSRPYTILF
jgi:hypothetical protein